MRVLATIAFSFAAGLFLVLLLPWSGWYLWAAAGLALAALGLYLWGRTQKRFRRSRLILWPLAASLVYFTAYQAVVQQPVLDLCGTETAFAGTVCTWPRETERGAAVTVRLHGMHGAKATYYGGEELLTLEPGQTLSGAAWWQDASNIRGTELTQFTARGVYALLYQRDEPEVGQGSAGKLRWLPLRAARAMQERAAAIWDDQSVQGFLIAYLEIQPFIVTLAGMFFAKGMTTIVNATQFNVENEAFKALKETRIYVPGMGSVNKLGAYVPAYVEIGVVVALVVVAVLFVVLRWTRFGRSVYAVGGNSYSANMLAINVKRTKFLAHLICGILAGIGGFVYFLHVGSGSPSHASGAEMNAIAASIIGGTMLTGGVGNIIGTFFGVLSLSTIKNIVSSLGLDEAWWTNITVAGMICLFLVIQSLVLSRKNKDS